MKLLFVTFPAPSHYFPMVPLAWACRCAGHDVLVACPPSFTGVVTRSGLPAVATGPEPDLAAPWKSNPSQETSPAELRHARAMAMFTMAAAETAGQTVEFARAWRPDLIVYEPRAYAGPLTADALGVPLVRHLYGTDYTFARAEPEAPALDALLRRFGAEETDPLGAMTIDPCPPRMQIPGPARRQRIRYVPYNGPGGCPPWLLHRDARLRVCVSRGLTHAKTAEELAPVREAVIALAPLHAEIVAAVPEGGASLLGPVPGNVRVAESVPLHLLLPSCAAIVHQGGAGTTMTAVSCGVPQLVLPDVADRVLNAAQLAAAGAGLAIPHDEATGDKIAGSVLRLLEEPSYTGAARALAREVACQPTPADAVPALEDLAAGKLKGDDPHAA
jgi:UDP:flavonoid glycosyltransferase YjiC (YdhE family)